MSLDTMVPLIDADLRVPQILPDDSARTRKSDPVTSHQAADATAHKVHPSQQYVLDTLMWYGPMADHELVEFHENEVAVNGGTRYSASRLRSARAEQVKFGNIEDSGVRTTTPGGGATKVWRVTR